MEACVYSSSASHQQQYWCVPDFSSRECGDVWNIYHIIGVWAFNWTFYSVGAQEINNASGMHSDRHCSCYSLHSYYQFIPYLATYGQFFALCTESLFTNIFAAFATGTYGHQSCLSSIVLVENLVWMKLLFYSPNSPKVRERGLSMGKELKSHHFFFSFEQRCNPNALDLNPVRFYAWKWITMCNPSTQLSYRF